MILVERERICHVESRATHVDDMDERLIPRGIDAQIHQKEAKLRTRHVGVIVGAAWPCARGVLCIIESANEASVVAAIDGTGFLSVHAGKGGEDPRARLCEREVPSARAREATKQRRSRTLRVRIVLSANVEACNELAEHRRHGRMAHVGRPWRPVRGGHGRGEGCPRITRG